MIDISYDDIELLNKYLQKHAQGQPVSVEICTLEAVPRLKIKVKTNREEHVSIIIYDKAGSKMPVISWEERLAGVL